MSLVNCHFDFTILKWKNCTESACVWDRAAKVARPLKLLNRNQKHAGFVLTTKVSIIALVLLMLLVMLLYLLQQSRCKPRHSLPWSRRLKGEKEVFLSKELIFVMLVIESFSFYVRQNNSRDLFCFPSYLFSRCSIEESREEYFLRIHTIAISITAGEDCQTTSIRDGGLDLRWLQVKGPTALFATSYRGDEAHRELCREL